MKNKILYGIIALVMSVFMVGCSDDDYAINNKALLTDESIVTGSADVTATSATFHGTVKGLEGQASSAYAVGFLYGEKEDDLSESVVGNSESEFSATITGTTGQVVYYQAYVTLQGRVTYKGEVQSTILTDAKAFTGEASDVAANTVTLSGSLEKAPADAKCGFILSGSDDLEEIRASLPFEANELSDEYTVNVKNLVPNTTYHYVAYLDLGAGKVYGEEKTFTTTEQNYDIVGDFVDLGLSTRWCKYNVGASSESELGGLFAFGDMTGTMTTLDMDSYASGNISGTDMDLASKTFGVSATVPTQAEWDELFSLCKKQWVEQDGMTGYKLTGPNGNSIFLPAAGSRTQTTVSGVGSEGHYLSGDYLAGGLNDGSKYVQGYGFNQSAVSRTSTPAYQAVSVRAVSKGFTAKLTCYGEGPSGDEAWKSATTTVVAGVAGNQYEITFDANEPRKNGQVYVLDIVGFAKAYPKAMVRIDEIKADGKDVKFDANKFFYGDLEDNGNYRVEMANIWGCGHNDGWNGLKDTPFHKGGGETTNETALAFNKTFTVKFTVSSITSDGTGKYTPQLATVASGWWPAEWGYNDGSELEVVKENNQYKIKGNASFDFKYTTENSYANGVIMTFININELGRYFKPHATLDALLLDGKNISFDASKVLDSADGDVGQNYRLELWNCYGKTSQVGCAFGNKDGDVIKELGFEKSCETKFTVHSLFQVPNW